MEVPGSLDQGWSYERHADEMPWAKASCFIASTRNYEVRVPHFASAFRSSVASSMAPAGVS